MSGACFGEGWTRVPENVLCAGGSVVSRGGAFRSLSKYLRFPRTAPRGVAKGSAYGWGKLTIPKSSGQKLRSKMRSYEMWCRKFL